MVGTNCFSSKGRLIVVFCQSSGADQFPYSREMMVVVFGDKVRASL
jgi:hypothetical protein